MNANDVLVVKERDKFISHGRMQRKCWQEKIHTFTSNQIRQGPEMVEEQSSDHPGKEDETSDLAEQRQQDAMEAKKDGCSGTTTSSYLKKGHFLFH